jgi:probable F420-dependent oxidoreductase
MHPFRFGIQASTPFSAIGWRELARKAESLGYSTMTIPDHFGNQFAAIPALMAAADATTTLRVGALVWDNDYRHPLVLAKEIATLDVLSEGRVEIGLGAGWLEEDYLTTGIPFDRIGVRISRLEEALPIFKAAFRSEKFSLSGDHYTVKDFQGFPAPLQQPHPPILLGGGGKRMLTLAAKHASIVGINGTLAKGSVDSGALASMSATAVDEKITWVREAAGENFSSLELNIRAFLIHIDDDRDAYATNIAAAIKFSKEDILTSPFVLIGSIEQICNDLLARREKWGLSYIGIESEHIETFAPIVARLAGR